MSLKFYILPIATLFAISTISVSASAQEKDRQTEEDEVGTSHDLDAEAVARRIFTIQYLAGGDYEPGLGLAFYYYPPTGIGYFAGFQIGVKEQEPFYDDLSLGSFGDPIQERFQTPLVVNVGITKSLGRLGIFGGVGYGSAEGIARKYDPLHILGDDGTYYVGDPQNDESGFNLTGGSTISFDKISMDIGYNSFTSSIYVGMGGNF